MDVQERFSALAAREALVMPGLSLRQLTLHLKCFSLAPWASRIILVIPLDLSCISTGMRAQCLCRVCVSPVAGASPTIPRSTILASIATLAVNIPILTVADILGADILLTGLAQGALLVVALTLGHHAFIMEDLTIAAGAGGVIPLPSHYSCGAKIFQHITTRHCVGSARVLLVVALLADNLAVRGVAGNELVQRPLAVPTAEALLVVPVVQGYHLLSRIHLHNTIIMKKVLNFFLKRGKRQELGTFFPKNI